MRGVSGGQRGRAARPGRTARWLAVPAILLVRLYRAVVAPWLPPICRYQPSCSCYALDALRDRGLWVGGALALCRLLRCNPFTRGGFDPVPEGRAGAGTLPQPAQDPRDFSSSH